MSRRAQIARRYLEVLNELEVSATPSEKEYYARIRDRHERVLASDEEEAEADRSPAAVAESLDAGYQDLYSMQHNLSKPNLDQHWKKWLEHQIKLYKEEINKIESQLRETGYTYEPPQPDLRKIAEEEIVEKRQFEIQELETLKALKLAWAERSFQMEKFQREIDEIQEKIDKLKQ